MMTTPETRRMIWSCYLYNFLHKHSFDNFCIDLRSTRWQELLLTDNYSLTSIGCLLGTNNNHVDC